MATRTTPFAAGTPCWVDLLSSDVDRAKRFYHEVFGWDAVDSDQEFGGYVNFESDGHKVAGMMANAADSGMPDVWSTYLSTDDLPATVDAAVRAGGTIVAAPMQVGDLGSMAIVTDAAGAVVGFWQAGKHTGFGKYNEPGSVTWDELHSKNFAASREFYAAVLGWGYQPMSDTDEFRYFTGQVNGETVAGLMDSASFLPAEVPSMWTVYFATADIDATVEKVVAAGGRVIRPPETTPFGRIGEFADPTGAMFKLHTEAEQAPESSG
ncbi:MAG TPA: VOC family protein [Jatrophihabitans sp.]|nr:VOC family protein [Jatrophihabitans sp.]